MHHGHPWTHHVTKISDPRHGRGSLRPVQWSRTALAAAQWCGGPWMDGPSLATQCPSQGPVGPSRAQWNGRHGWISERMNGSKWSNADSKKIRKARNYQHIIIIHNLQWYNQHKINIQVTSSETIWNYASVKLEKRSQASKILLKCVEVPGAQPCLRWWRAWLRATWPNISACIFFRHFSTIFIAIEFLLGGQGEHQTDHVQHENPTWSTITNVVYLQVHA